MSNKMKHILLSWLACTLLCMPSFAKKTTDQWPDGSEISEWFKQTTSVDIQTLGKAYHVTDYGVVNDGKLHTTEMQALINKVASEGGGVIVIPEGTYMTGAIFFKQGVHLHLYDGATLMGSSDPSDYPIIKTRIEGVDGNGYTFWKHFWERRSWNPQCTNKDEQRPRLVYISNSKNVQIDGVKLQNSAFWTTHIYNSENVKLLRLHIYSPEKPVKAPSTDAIDLDVVKNVLVKDCYMSVNDDAVAIKGGKGPYADYWRTPYEGIDINKYPEMIGDGSNENIIIEDCEYGFCHGCLTLGSESVYDHNIILRRIKVTEANNLLWLKMRPDTPQTYEYVMVEDIEGNGKNFLLVAPWTQFYDLKGRESIPMSYSNHITMRNITFDCNVFFNVKQNEDQYHLSNFTFENLAITAQNTEFHQEYVENFTVKNVKAEKKP